MKKGVALIGALLFLYGTAYATVWYVHPDSTLNSIQAALDSCADNDTVLVGPSIYYENPVWPNTQGIDLISEYGPDTTIIDGDILNRVIIIAIAVDPTTIIEGFTIRNGYIPDAYGGGIYCAGASPTITGNIISYNTAEIGGGIACEFCYPFITGNIIVENTAIVAGWLGGFGGGVWCNGSWATIAGNTIIGNSAENCGGGILCMACYDSSLTIYDNTITENSSACGAGIGCIKSSPIISDNIITDNVSVDEGGGVYCFDNASPRLSRNVIAGNTADDGAGIYCMDSSSPVIDSCMISNNHGDGVYLQPILYGGPSCPVLHYNNIVDNEGYGVNNTDSTIFIDATYNWWGDTTGPYHSMANPNGLGDSVSDYVDFDPWLLWPVGVEEQPILKPVEKHEHLSATIFSGPLILPEGRNCMVYDITGRVVTPDKMRPGVYFVEVDGVITRKVVKIR